MSRKFSHFGIAIFLMLLPVATAPAYGIGTSCAIANPGSVMWSTGCSAPLVTVSDLGRLAVIDINSPIAWRTVVVRVYHKCMNFAGSGWMFHLGDSPTNNGFGGDGGSTDHDAEVQFVNGTVTPYRSDIGGSTAFPSTVIPGTSCNLLLWEDYVISNDFLRIAYSTPAVTILPALTDPALFDLAPYDEADTGDPTNLHASKLYAGFNRTYGLATRSGTGVVRACIYVTTDLPTAYSPAVVTTACPLP